ncbi:PREDICTED: zinc finger MYND domain-containing protein 12 [Chaetura pelagica]|nr:PREDICTED: zinc finger MYND domain-containing protein 12 [Chaetura pelagica]
MTLEPARNSSAVSDVDHQKADWVSIHKEICQLLIPIQTPLPFLLTENERKQRREQLVERQKHVLGLVQRRAQGLVWEGRHPEAIPAALQAVRLGAEVHGSDSVQLVPSYLLLAEASTGAGCLQEASKYLSQAEWIVLSTPSCSDAVRSQVQRALGLFCVAEGNLDQALHHLANDVYLASSTFGLRSLEVSGGYFHMANIFSRQNKLDIANSLYTEVTAICHSWLLSLVQAQEQILQAEPETSPFAEDREVSGDQMSEAQQEEAARVLGVVLGVREQAPKQQPGETSRVLHALAMLWYLSRDFSKAREMGLKALDLVKQLPHQESLEHIGRLLKLINSQPSCTK